MLAKTVESVFAQTYPVHEVIVIDDNSDDNTCEVLRAFGSRITALKGPGKGSSVARNLGILVATGDHIAFLDADDLWLPHKLEQQIKLLSDDCGFVFADWYRSDNPGTRVPRCCKAIPGSPKARYSPTSFARTSSRTPTVIVRKELLAHTGLFQTQVDGQSGFRSVAAAGEAYAVRLGTGTVGFHAQARGQHHEQPAIPILSGAAMAGVAA